MHTLTDPIDGVRFVLVGGVKVAIIKDILPWCSTIALCDADGNRIGSQHLIDTAPEAIPEWMASDLCDPITTQPYEAK